MKIRWTEAAFNLIFWAASAWLIISGFSVESREIEIVNGTESIHTIRNASLQYHLVLLTGFSILMFYTNLLNMKRLNQRGPKSKILLITVLIYTFSLAAFLITESFIAGGLAPSLPFSLSFGILIFYFTISVSYGLGRVWVQTEKQHQILLTEKKEAELTLLRNQLQPHFLFNALNNLLSMVDQQKSPKLAESFDQLSMLLRYVIDDTRPGNVTVSQEIAFLRNYVALQLLRFVPGEIIFDIQVDGTYGDQKVEPGLFIPFVENAFKYGPEPEKQSSISLGFDISRQNEIIFRIVNKISSYRVSDGGAGTGIASTQKRLNLIYPGKHTLEIIKDEDFLVILKIETE